MNLITFLGEKLKQRLKTIHYAIVYANILLENDSVFNKYYEDEGRMKIKMDENLLGATCLLIASKFYEIDENLILVSDIQKELSDNIDLKIRIRGVSVYRTEIEILKRMDWNMLRPLPIDYMQTMF